MNNEVLGGVSIRLRRDQDKGHATPQDVIDWVNTRTNLELIELLGYALETMHRDRAIKVV